MIIVITTAITYTSFSMNQMSQLAETIGIKQTTDQERSTEKFEIIKVQNDNNQFNMTIKNTGDLPVHLTRLWIENTTDSTWPISKFDLDVAIPPGKTVKNIGQNIGLTALDTQSYYAQIISERGNQKQMYFNSVGDTSLFLRLSATPVVMPTTFTSTVTLEVINTGTSQLLNLQPDTMQILTPTCNDCVVEYISGPTPTNFESLAPGDTAIFEWAYKFTGGNGDELQLTTGLLNDIETDSITITLQTIESALNAEVAIESGGLGDQVLIDDDILLFHLETSEITSGTAYQMWSGIGDGGNNGDRIQLDSETPHFVTNNGSAPITIPEGSWNVAMMLKSEAVAPNVDTGYDMIFHFEDGDNQDPDNSQGSANRDLEECGTSNYIQSISVTANDAEERASNGNMYNLDDGDLDLAYDGGENNEVIVGLRFTNINIVQGTDISSAEIIFEGDEGDSNSVSLAIYAEDTDDASAFTSSNSNISNRQLTGNVTLWSNVPSWSNGERGGDTTTPDISNLIQEIIDRDDWSSGNDIVIIFYDNGSTGQRAAESYDGGETPPQLLLSWGSGAIPDWQDNSGPHGSGSYYFDGSQECFRSSNDVSGGDDNDIGSGFSTTSLWFKTDGPVSSEQYLLDWSADGCPLCDYYRIGLDSVGKLFFEYETNSGLLDVVRCESTNEYDTDEWYHVVVSRDGAGDECAMEIRNLDGTDAEGRIFVNENTGTSAVDVEGRWHVAANKDEDGKFFNGWIDDVMHWDDDELSTAEMDDLARTNYGDGAHQFNLNLDRVDANGNLIGSLYSTTAVNTAFADSKNGGNNDDWAYSQSNMTMSMPEIILNSDERLELYFEWVGPTATWEALEVDMKIDDTDMNDPYPSFMQIPFPSDPFPSYYTHDNDDEFELFVANSGDDGVFFTYQGTRVNFNGTNGAFAGLIHSVNGTGGGGGDWWNLDEDRDSLYIPAGAIAKLYFHEATDVPSTDESGNILAPGSYRTTIWLNGYTDQGETFTRSVVVGSVTVVD